MTFDGLYVRVDLWRDSAYYLEPFLGQRLDGGEEWERRRKDWLGCPRSRLINKWDHQPVIEQAPIARVTE